MELEFFEQLTVDDAHAFLEGCRAIGADGLEKLERLVRDRDGGPLDFSADSIRAAFEVIANEVATTPAALDESLPDWIKTSENYRAGLYEFSDHARVLILRLSYYFAET